MFEKHSHESKQITLVPEGKLDFDFDGKTMGANRGVTIAIPFNVFHAVFTKTGRTIAMMTSPVMEKYRQVFWEKNAFFLHVA